MIAVDTSALLAILLEEPERRGFVERIAGETALMSVASYVEASLRLERLAWPLPADALDNAIATLALRLEPVAAEHGRIAREADRRFGKGKHPAGLNFGDCLVYALAKTRGCPLLFKGDDFAQTDIPSAR